MDVLRSSPTNILWLGSCWSTAYVMAQQIWANLSRHLMLMSEWTGINSWIEYAC